MWEVKRLVDRQTPWPEGRQQRERQRDNREIKAERQTDRKIVRQTDRERERRTLSDRQTDSNPVNPAYPTALYLRTNQLG